jgi:hypothetical protein
MSRGVFHDRHAGGDGLRRAGAFDIRGKAHSIICIMLSVATFMRSLHRAGNLIAGK